MIALMLPLHVTTCIVSMALVSGATHTSAQPRATEAHRRITLGVVDPGTWKRDTSNTSAVRGTTMGIEEAQRTAAMFGWELVVMRAPDSLSSLDALQSLARGGADAVVGDFSAHDTALSEMAPRPVVLDIGRSSRRGIGCSDSRFRLLPAAADSSSAWYPSLERYGAGQLNDRYRKRFDAEMDDRAWAAWMAVKIIIDASLKTGSSEPRSIESYLVHAGRFDGHKGVPLFFDAATRELVQPLFSLAGNVEQGLAGSIPSPFTPAVTVKCPGE
jgi:hypothetical protein